MSVCWHIPMGVEPCDCPGHIEMRVREQVVAFLRKASSMENAIAVIETVEARLTDEPLASEAAFDRWRRRQ